VLQAAGPKSIVEELIRAARSWVEAAALLRIQMLMWSMMQLIWGWIVMTSSTVLLCVIAGELGLLLLPEILWGSRWSRRVSVVVSCRRPTLGLVFLLLLVRLVIVEAMARRAERRRRRKWSVRISVSSVVHPQNLTTKKHY
jgi:hypothetical protein